MQHPHPLYHLTKLPNRLQVLTIPMRERESAAVAVWVRVGGRFEPKRISGVSHFLEHMLFKGTKKRSTRDIKKEVEGVGGVLNAFTAEEATCYFAKLPAEHFKRAGDVLVDMVKDATLSLKEMERERPVILEEIKMYRDQPAQYVHELMSELLWPDQALGRSLAGVPETVAAINRQSMLSYKNKYYQPPNILISVSGPVSHSEVVELAEKFYSSAKGNGLSQFAPVKVSQKKPAFIFVEKETEQTHVVIAFHGFSKRDPRRYALGLLNVMLGANMSSRLFEEVRERRGLAYEIKSGTGYYQDAGSFSVSAGVENKKIQLAIQVILQVLGKIIKKSVPAEELRRAKDYYLGQFLMGLEDTLDHLLWVGEKVLYNEGVPNRQDIAKEIEKVKAADIQKVARQIFQTSHLNLTMIGPQREKEHNQIKKNAFVR